MPTYDIPIGPGEEEALKRLRQFIDEKRAQLSPEDFRKWAERLLMKWLGEPVIVKTSHQPGEDEGASGEGNGETE